MPEVENAFVQLRRGTLAYCVLAMLSAEERYGFDLVEELVEADLVTSEGTVYPLLARLRREGLVSFRWQESPSGPPRRYYAATESGRAAVAEFAGGWFGFAGSVSQVLRRGMS